MLRFALGRFCLALLALAVVAAPGATAATSPASYFIAPTGSDVNACSATAPCLTMNRAYHLAAPGQVIELAGGTYALQRLTYDASKVVVSANVTFRSAPGQLAVLAAGLMLDGAQHVTVLGNSPNSNLVRLAALQKPADGITLKADPASMDTGSYLTLANCANNDTFSQLDMEQFSVNGSDGTLIDGGSIGGYDDSSADSYVGPPYLMRSTTWCQGHNPVNTHLTHIVFHDVLRTNYPTAHPDCLQFYGSDGVVVDYDSFARCGMSHITDRPSGTGAVEDHQVFDHNLLGPLVEVGNTIAAGSGTDAMGAVTISNNVCATSCFTSQGASFTSFAVTGNWWGLLTQTGCGVDTAKAALFDGNTFAAGQFLCGTRSGYASQPDPFAAPAPPPVSPVSTANVWVSANGSDTGTNCKVSAAPVANPDATGSSLCRTLDKAYQLAPCGGTVLVLPGTYPSQSVSYFAAKDACSSSSRVAIKAAGGGATYLANLTISGRHVLVDGLDGDPAVQSNLTVQTLPTFTSPNVDDVVTQNMVWSNGGVTCVKNLTQTNVEWNGANSDPLVNGVQVSRASTCPFHNTNIVWDHVYIHDIRCPATSCAHAPDGLHAFDFDGFVIRNSRFVNNQSAQVFFKGMAGDLEQNLTFENNWVGGGGIHELYIGDKTNKTNFLVRNNSINGQVINLCHDNNGCVNTNVRLYGNITVAMQSSMGAFCSSGNHDIAEDYNVVQTLGTRVNGCGVHDVVESPLKYVNPSAFDLHLQTSSLALGLVPLSLCASSDIDGNPRPLVASATTCDAGADEQ